VIYLQLERVFHRRHPTTTPTPPPTEKKPTPMLVAEK